MAVVWMDGQGYRIAMSILHVSHTKKDETTTSPYDQKLCSVLTDQYSDKIECRIYVYSIYVLVH